MAGLGAARLLQDAGPRVTVIEARDRIGGRTHTSHLWPDLPVDMGASWIRGTKGNPVAALAKEQGPKLTATDYERSVTHNETGREVPFIKPARQTLAPVEKAREKIDDADHDVSLQAAIEGSKAWQRLSPQDRRVARLAINTRIEHEYSGNWSQLSAWDFDLGKDFLGDEAVVTPGFGTILAALARGIDLRLGEAVTAVAPTAQGVTVATTYGRHMADRVIVTLPLGVLQSGRIRFVEPLDRKRQRAIDRLGLGLLNKCVLRFDRAFWPADKDWIDFLCPIETLWADWTNYLPATGRPLIAAFNAARLANEVEGWSDRDTTASALDALRAMFGSTVSDPTGSQISRSRKDPFALGASSVKAVGSSRKDRKALYGAD
jgi:monoamine oxidase